LGGGALIDTLGLRELQLWADSDSMDDDAARWESWRKLRREAERHERLTDRVSAEAARQRNRKIHKAMRAYYKDRR
jgi:hypothetical protein